MNAIRHLRVIDDNGEVVESDDPHEQVQALKSALVRAERVITGLRLKSAEERKNYGRRGDVETVFAYWQHKLGKKKSKLTDDRFDAIKALLEKEYKLEHFFLVVDALAAYPYERYGKRYADGKKHEVKIDVGWACEKGRRFEELAVLGHELKRAA
jgi:uncharacterized phage protein (TIGR02220 family)